jgi:hypothetical protein
MKKMTKVLLALIINAFMFSQYFHELKTTQSLGMGGTKLFNYYNTRSVLDNPSLVSDRGLEISVLDFKINADASIYDIIDYVNNHEDDFDNLSEYSEDKENPIYKNSIQRIKDDLRPLENIEYRTQISPGLGIVFNGFALNIYNTTTLEIRPDVVFTPKVTVNAASDMNIAFAVGQRFTKKLQIGAALRARLRGTADELLFDIINVASNGDDLENIVTDTLKESLNTGVSVDFGAIYDFNKQMRFAASLRNFPGTIEGDKQVHLDLGVEYDIWLVKAIFEVHDFFGTYGNSYWHNIHMGARMHLPFFKRISVSAGLNQGFPSIGIDMDLWYAQLAYSYYQQSFSASSLTQDKTNFHSINFRLFF